MRKRLPLWLAAVVPAMLAGHAWGYGLAGRPLLDGRHGWFVFTLENSGVALLAVCAILTVCAVLYAKLLKSACIETSLLQLWPRLAIAQIALFAVAESFEGLQITAIGILTQLATALCAAYLLSLFARILGRCVQSSAEATRHLERLFDAGAIFLIRDRAPRGLTLFACAGPNSFQRPPPFAL